MKLGNRDEEAVEDPFRIAVAATPTSSCVVDAADDVLDTSFPDNLIPAGTEAVDG
jgi:hypothetical protein